MRAIILLFFSTICFVASAQQKDSVVYIPKDEVWGWHRELYCSVGVGVGFENSFHSDDMITKYKVGFSYKQTGCYSIAFDPMSYLIWLDTKQGDVYKAGASVNFFHSTPKDYKVVRKHRWLRWYSEHLVIEAGLGFKKTENQYHPMIRFSPKINYTLARFQEIGSYINVLPFYCIDMNYNSTFRFDNSIGMKLVWQIGFW